MAGDARTWDVVVVGGGPAGLTAALLLGRSRRSVLVVDDGQPRNASALALHGFPSRDGVAPLDLLGMVREELGAYGVRVRHGRVVSAHGSGNGTAGFEVTLETGRVYHCRRLLLATGVTDVLPEVEGMSRFYGRGVHHCPFCDGWEVRDRKLVAFGAPPASARLALHLLTWSRDVVVCTDGASVGASQRRRLARNGVALVEDRVLRLDGSEEGEGGRLQAVVLEDGRRVPADAVFLGVERVQHSDLPARLGCDVEGARVRVRGAQHTTVPGLYLAGDAAGDVQFAVVAAAQGARAAVAINRDLEREDLA